MPGAMAAGLLALAAAGEELELDAARLCDAVDEDSMQPGMAQGLHAFVAHTPCAMGAARLYDAPDEDPEQPATPQDLHALVAHAPCAMVAGDLGSDQLLALSYLYTIESETLSWIGVLPTLLPSPSSPPPTPLLPPSNPASMATLFSIPALMAPTLLPTPTPTACGNRTSATFLRAEQHMGPSFVPTPASTALTSSPPSLPAPTPTACGNRTSATFRRAEQHPARTFIVPRLHGVAQYNPTPKHRQKMAVLCQFLRDHGVWFSREGVCHPLVRLCAFDNRNECRVRLAARLFPASRSSALAQKNLAKFLNDLGFRACGRKSPDGQTPLRVFHVDTWNHRGYRTELGGKLQHVGHPALEFVDVPV